MDEYIGLESKKIKNSPVMPDDLKTDSKDSNPDSIVRAVVNKIDDSIQDDRILRNFRKPISYFLIGLSVVFYIIFFFILYLLFRDESEVGKLATDSPTLMIVLMIILAIVPTMLILIVVKAVYGIRKSTSDSMYSPIDVLLNLIKEIKSS